MVEEFEKALQPSATSSHCAAVSSGTDALRFALDGFRVKPGDVVVTVPNTFIATTEAISQAGACRNSSTSTSVPTTYVGRRCCSSFLSSAAGCKSGKLISLRSGRPVTAVVPVHLYGQMADMDAILSLADNMAWS
jgi:dTDP-4-amino-4,6-dideoxygalactose transaminase